jgi:hypothetical protein
VAEEEAVTVMVAVLLLVSKAPTEQVTPTSEPEALQVNVGVAEKLFRGVKLSVEVPLPPGAIVREMGETLSEKSGATVVKLETLDQAAIWPLPEGARACTCQ